MALCGGHEEEERQGEGSIQKGGSSKSRDVESTRLMFVSLAAYTHVIGA